MSDLKRSCPACESWTTAIGEAFRDGEPCPSCGAPAAVVAGDEVRVIQVGDFIEEAP